MRHIFKKRNLVIVFTVLIAAFFGFLFIFNYPKIKNKFQNITNTAATSTPDLSPQAVTGKCQSDLSGKADEELMAEIKKLKYPIAIDKVSGLERMTYAQKKIIQYFVCKIKRSGDEASYHTYEEYIKKLDIQKKNKQTSLSELAAAYEKTEDKNGQAFFNLLTYGDLDEICPAELPKICSAEYDSAARKALNCQTICTTVAKDKNAIKNDILIFLEKNSWAKSVELIRLQYREMIALALRNKEGTLAKWVCENVSHPSEKPACHKSIENTFNLIKSIEKNSCDNIYSNLQRIICDVI